MLIASLLLATLLACSGATPTAAPGKLELWFYQATNLAADDAFERTAPIWRRAAAAGYTRVMLADPRFARPADQDAGFRTHAAALRALADSLHLEIVPGIASVGHANGGILTVDPNLAEAFPVRNALFEMHGGVARLMPDPPVTLATPTTDPAMAVSAGIATAKEPVGVARILFRGTPVAPYRCYHLSFEVRTQGFSGEPGLQLHADGRRISFARFKCAATQDWTPIDVVFDSFDHHLVDLSIGSWHSAHGTMQIRRWQLEECGPVNLVRRAGAPLVVREERGGRVLREGVDFEPFADTLLGMTPWRGQFTAWHAPAVLRSRTLADDTRLRVSWYQAAIFGRDQAIACLSDSGTMAVILDGARATQALFGTHSAMLLCDEIRAIGWDRSCTASGHTPGRLLGDFIRTLAGRLSGTRLYVWSDMFDPEQNAVKEFTLVNGDLTGSWEGLPHEVTVVNWNGPKFATSLPFFATRGHAQVIAAYYDGKPDGVRDALAAARGVPHITGVMYTTWNGRYDDLEAFARAVAAR